MPDPRVRGARVEIQPPEGVPVTLATELVQARRQTAGVMLPWADSLSARLTLETWAPDSECHVAPEEEDAVGRSAGFGRHPR